MCIKTLMQEKFDSLRSNSEINTWEIYAYVSQD